MVDEAKEKLLRWFAPVVIALLGGLARQAKDHRVRGRCESGEGRR